MSSYSWQTSAGESSSAAYRPQRCKERAEPVKHNTSFNYTTYVTKGVPRLEKFVPADALPDILLVNDMGNLTNLCPDKCERVLYRRAYPDVPRDLQTSLNTRRRHGFLHLDTSNVISKGRRATVIRAPLTACLDARSPKRYTVVAKLPNDTCRSHHLLEREAKAYNSFPREFFVPFRDVESREYLTHPAPRPAMLPDDEAWSGSSSDPDFAAEHVPAGKETAPPIVPRFYGMYVPVAADGGPLTRSHPECNEFGRSSCRVRKWPRAILLMEDCGEQIDVDDMRQAQRRECFDLLARMHCQGFTHGLPTPENILVQPGPLTKPTAERSYLTPSYRFISFGRWRAVGHMLPMESMECSKVAFYNGMDGDMVTLIEMLRVFAADPDEEDLDEDDGWDSDATIKTGSPASNVYDID